METIEQIGQMVRCCRGEMSLRAFAEKCGVSHTTIDNLERGIDPRTGKPPQIKLATMYNLRWLESRGKELSEMGITLENIEDQITRTDTALGEVEQQ